MARNGGISETQLADMVEQGLRDVLPQRWSMDVTHQPLASGLRLDLVVALHAPDGSRALLVVETKHQVAPGDMQSVLDQLTHHKRSVRQDGDAEPIGIVAAPYLSPRTRELLDERGFGWFDATGNLRVRADAPALFIDRHGADRNPFTDADDRRLRSLRGPGAARVVRALLDGQGPIGVRALGAEAGVSAATSSRVLDLLSREALVDRSDNGAITGVRKRSLLRQWTQDYGLTTTNGTAPTLAPRGIDRTLTDLAVYDRRYAITGTAALRTYLPGDEGAVAPLALLTIFVDRAPAAQRELGLRPVDKGANVLLVEAFDDVVYRGSHQRDGLVYAGPSQTLADLLTGVGRQPEEGEQLLDILARQDAEWKR
jgi:hypothetical protein